jgi:TetR/AcrR family transcriptional regulator, transcriptional repressor for nem operon
MRYPPEHKQRTREKILSAAGRVFRRQGYHAAGVDAVMEEAGLTAGGFYAHFPSKEALLGEVLTHATADAAALLLKELEGRSGRDWVVAFVEGYLSPGHRRKVAEGCPIPCLISEVGRAGEASRKTFAETVGRMSEKLEGELAGDPSASNDRALAIVALCVGGMALARGVGDELLADRILAACRTLALKGLTEDLPSPKRSAKGLGKPRARE